MPLAFYSRKLNPAQLNYTPTERELLSIVETLNEFKNILFGTQDCGPHRSYKSYSGSLGLYF
eukprot:6903245-Ditylum_brightwellii.AAC.1